MTAAYEELEEAWKREFHSKELQPLKQGLFKDLGSYVKRLRDAQRNLDSKSLKAVILLEEMQRLEQLLVQLVDRRSKKLWESANAPESSALASSEKQAYEAVSAMTRYYQKIKEDILQGREPSTAKVAEKGMIIVRFVKDVPSIIGADLKTHGPFMREDVARLPHENAESLVRQGAAVEIGPSLQDNE